MHAALLALALSVTPYGPGIPGAPRFASLQGGETLGPGGAEAVFSAGYSTASAAYALGVSEAVDLAAMLELDWVVDELFAGGFYRSLIWRHGDVALSWRARAGLYLDFGATWAVSSNRSDVGLQLAPGIALSVRFTRGILSLAADVPVTPTFNRGGGWLFAPRGTVAFETPLWGDILAGARAGVGGVWSYSGAPYASESPRATLDLSLLVTYRVF